MNVAFGIGLAVVVVFAYYHRLGEPGGENIFCKLPGQIYQGVLTFGIGFLGGSMFYVLLALGWTAYHVGYSDRMQKMKVSVFQLPAGIFNVISRFMLKVCFVATALYLLGVSRLYVQEYMQHEGLNPKLGGLPIFFGIFIFAYFVVTQLSVHDAMRKAKNRELSKLAPTIEKRFELTVEDPHKDNIDRLRDLFELQRTLAKSPSWDFGWKELIPIFGTVLVPLIVLLVENLPG